MARELGRTVANRWKNNKVRAKVVIGTLREAHAAKRPIGTTGRTAKFSATTNATNATPVPVNKPMMTGEVHAYASPARFNATMRSVSHVMRRPMPNTSSERIVLRRLGVCICLTCTE